jgi:hypothetical protein
LDIAVTYQSVYLHIIWNRIFHKYYSSLITWFLIFSFLDSMAHHQKSNSDFLQLILTAYSFLHSGDETRIHTQILCFFVCH